MLKLNYENGRGYLNKFDNLKLYVDGKFVFDGKPNWNEIFDKYGKFYINSELVDENDKLTIRLLTWD